MDNQPERSTSSGSLSQVDHDTLIELKTSFAGFLDRYVVDMKDLKDGVKTRVDDHEMRVKKIENEILAIGGTEVAWKRFLIIEKWVNDFQLKWKTIVGVAVTLGSLVTFILGLIAKLTGLLK